MWALALLGVIFSLLAFVMAVLITLNEYSKHFVERRKAFRSALGTAAVTFLFFCALVAAAGLVLSKVLSGGH